MIRQIRKSLPLIIFFLLVIVSLAVAAEHGGEDGRKIWDMTWRIINFAILVIILYKLLADKVKKYFSERRTEIAQLLEDVDKAKRDTDSRHAEYKEKLKNVEKDIQEIRQVLLGEIEKEKARIIEEGKIASKRLIEQAKDSAQQEIQKAKAGLKDTVADMACKLAADIIEKKITADDQKRIIEEYLDKVVRQN
ncbi:MAG: ATP synthase F0 subunit B [Deltaproteobacteria bacterium]|nr:ATP synthase F0 subunit B [Deltaproteobacteria bacterium]